MAADYDLERLPMTMGYFRLILRCFGETPRKRAALLHGTGVSEAELASAAAEISVFQQVRQIENASCPLVPGWAVSRPQLWDLPAHGALGVAIVSAPTLGRGLEVLQRYGHVRSPWFRVVEREGKDKIRVELKLTVALDVEQWRPMMEIAFLAVKAMIGTALGRVPREIAFHFACPAPAHAKSLRTSLGSQVFFDTRTNVIEIPAAWRAIASAHADAPLFARAVAELEDVLRHLERPTNMKARVERLLRTMPDGRLDATSAASALGLSRRTLARRLNDADVSFRGLLDAELKARAERFLATRTLSRPDMADRLGYRDPTSFSRACRRWFAVSQGGLRRRADRQRSS